MTIDEVRQLGVSEIRNRFAAYLYSHGLAKNTVNTSCTDAFYLLRNNETLDFWLLLYEENFETVTKNHLDSALHRCSSGNIDVNINNYMFHIRQLRNFVIGEDAPIVQPIHNDIAIKSIRHKRKDLPYPSIEEVKKYLEQWETLDNYRLQEIALDKLFFKLAPHNTDISDILLKAATLNDFYSTNIFSVYPVAQHILSLDIDNRLSSGDVSLVDEMQTVTINGKTKKLYSFATKYCSHHQSEAYPIYDNYVDQVLCYFRDTEGFCEFAKNDLKIYGSFVNVLNRFQKFFGLNGYTLKELDRYLWQFGKTHFKKNRRRPPIIG